ncbi:MFS transporter [Phytohabitans sp. ZYX-F-186]|uniref:MFS transporter n=1 Tax=Phytohabitans maris TaxID=3071409 RepID=A0ABU0ZLS9_9ACTN|nr:MFS transporter [Phytohabitans sp. ZYX-F-186]MDQ7907551.1 MFS transporter [Phytohabitans sp. ZYX-F-186]
MRDRISGWRRASAESPVSMFSSLRVPNYRLYFVGQSISVAGNWMQNLAIGWLVLELTHSGTVLGVVTAARYAPLFLLGSWGGLLADRVDNRGLLTLTQTCSALLSFALALVSLSGTANVATVLVLVLLLGLVSVFDNPPRQSMISQLVPRPYLGNAIALNSISTNLARVVGPGVAGGIIATMGVTPCFFINAVSFLAVVGSLLVMRTSALVPTERVAKAKGQILAGWRYVASRPELRYPLMMVIVTGVLTWEFPVSLPLLTTGTFHAGAEAYGAALACLAVGSVVGGLVAARRRVVTVRSLAISALLWGGLICVASAAPTLPLAYVALTFVGSAAVTFSSMAKTLLQMECAPTMRGRVMSLWAIFWRGGSVLGAPLVGAIGTYVGPRYGLLVGGVAALACGGAVLALRFDRSPTAEVTRVDSELSP